MKAGGLQYGIINEVYAYTVEYLFSKGKEFFEKFRKENSLPNDK
jgi:hypothetical protein